MPPLVDPNMATRRLAPAAPRTLAHTSPLGARARARLGLGWGQG